MSLPECSFIKPGELRLHVATWGDPQKPPVLLVHGLWDHNRSWDWIAAELSRSYYVIAPDLRGHGESDWAGADGYTLGAYVLDLADLTDAMGLRRFLLVGHSLGGALGLRFASAYPEHVTAFVGIECVILPLQRDEMDTPTPYPLRLRQWIDKRRERRERGTARFADMQTVRRKLAGNHPSLDAETITHLAEHGVKALPDGGYTWKFDPHVRGRPPEDQRCDDLRDILRGIACPSILVYGDSDERPAPSPDMLDLMRNVKLETWPGASHSLHHQMRERFMDLLVPFLDEHIDELTR